MFGSSSSRFAVKRVMLLEFRYNKNYMDRVSQFSYFYNKQCVKLHYFTFWYFVHNFAITICFNFMPFFSAVNTLRIICGPTLIQPRFALLCSNFLHGIQQ